MKTKRKIWMSLSMVVVLVSLAVAGSFYSCEKQNIQPVKNNGNDFKLDSEFQNEYLEPCSPFEKSDIIIEGGDKVGEVVVFNDAKYLNLIVSGNKNHTIRNIYLFTGTRSQLPLNFDDDLDYRLFNHIIPSSEFERSRTIKIPIRKLPKTTVLSLRMEVKDISNAFSRYKIAWANGKEYGTISKGYVFTFNKRACKLIQPEVFDE